ncbi:protein tumorous imaginal discs, mitochondrial isoform X1 [Patella vulgata]|uniref:protein tumorous imaginal discs, mitochondrial isoform X1 n=1 Tax=Patella vulgata TaxID=6465 RepID=UPI00217F5E6C|nr:protein tumorous imaginal discs, mitochondrial isoform X1 [Patella vulgata]
MAAFRGACGQISLKNVCSSSLPLVCRHIKPETAQFQSVRFGSSLNFVVASHTKRVLTCHHFHRSSPCSYIHTSGSRDKKDYYEVLGVSKNADQATIKKAYYKLAKKYHPDMNKHDKSAAGKFQEVSEAYEVLSDSGKRKEYDSFGMGAGGGGRGFPGGGFGSAQGFEGFQSNIDPEELFRRIFKDAGFNMSGGGFGGGGGQDYAESKYGFAAATEAMMDLTFQEAARGVNKEMHINVKDNCPKCQGKKAEPGTEISKCPHCNGTGMETISTGPFMMRSTCRHCYGSRVIIKNPCSECAGKGKMILRKKVVVPVPAGVEDGQTVRMPLGSQEVFITFRVAKSRIFRREGADVHSDVHITLTQAVLGGSIRTPGIYDDIILNIPAGTQSHDRIRLQGKGITRVNSYGTGDHYLHIKIKIPTKLSPQQKALILSYAETEKKIEGTVNGITQTKTGLRAIEDDEGYVSQIREAAKEIYDTDNPKQMADKDNVS